MATSTPSLRRALREVGTVALFGVAPIVALSTMLVIGLDTDSIAADFHHELYPQTEEMLAGRNPYPSPDWDPTAAPNFIWPPAAAALAAPLTLLPLEAADIVIAALGLVVFALSLWLVGVRDWRVYGATACGRRSRARCASPTSRRSCACSRRSPGAPGTRRCAPVSPSASEWR